MMTLIARVLEDEAGATSIEYGLIIAMIFLAIVGSVHLFANNSTGMFNRTMDLVSAALP